MAKMPLGTVVVTNNSTGETIEYQSTVQPKKTTIGNSFCGTLNCNGIAKVQEKFPQVVNDKQYQALIASVFQAAGIDISAEDIGNRGGTWNSTAARQATSVSVNGEDWGEKCPLSEKALAAEVAQPTVEPIAVELVKEVAIEPAVEATDVAVEEAIADTTDKDEKNFATLLNQLQNGADREELRIALTSIAGAEKTTELFARADEHLSQAQNNPFM